MILYVMNFQFLYAHQIVRYTSEKAKRSVPSSKYAQGAQNEES